MLSTIQVICVIVAAIAMLPAVAHALELPGKMRLERDVYVEVQRIYYPGFTIAGFAELAAILASFALLFLTPARSLAFWLSASAFLALLAMHAVYWIVTHPVNKVWMDPQTLGAGGATFFSAGSQGTGTPARRGADLENWVELRDRWEYSHVARAVLASLAFVALVLALARDGQ